MNRTPHPTGSRSDGHPRSITRVSTTGGACAHPPIPAHQAGTASSWADHLSSHGHHRPTEPADVKDRPNITQVPTQPGSGACQSPRANVYRSVIPAANTDPVFMAALRILDDAHEQGMPETNPDVVHRIEEWRSLPDNRMAAKLNDQLLTDLPRVALWSTDPHLFTTSTATADQVLADWQDALTGRTRSRSYPPGALPIITTHHEAFTDTIRTWYSTLTPHLPHTLAGLVAVSFLANARFTLADAHTLLAAGVNPHQRLPVDSRVGSVLWALHRDSWPWELLKPAQTERLVGI